MRATPLLLAMLLAASASAQAAQFGPEPGASDAHIQTIDYRADRVVRLSAALGYQLTVALSPDEQVQTVAVGDAGSWQVTANRAGDHLFIKLAAGGGFTDMTVVTNVRQYVFELTPLASPMVDMAYTIRFRYPVTAPVRGAGAMAPGTLVGAYRVSGARMLRPSAIGDDGVRTFLEWPKDVDLPAVYMLDQQGREALINGMMRNDRLVIDAVVSRLVFRIDRQVAHAERVKPHGKRP